MVYETGPRIMMLPYNDLCRLTTFAFAAMFSCIGCGELSRKAPIKKWVTDNARVSRALPILTDIQSSEWHAGIAEDRSGGLVPAPSSVFMRGYAIIGRTNVDDLMAKYEWDRSDVKSSDLDLPPGALEKHLRGSLLESPDLVGSLHSFSPYGVGIVLICPEDGFVYFDIIKD
jgi:hypothetical protein